MLLAGGIVLVVACVLCARHAAKLSRATVLDEIQAAQRDGRQAREAVMDQTIQGIAESTWWLVVATICAFGGLGSIVYWMNQVPPP